MRCPSARALLRLSTRLATGLVLAPCLFLGFPDPTSAEGPLALETYEIQGAGHGSEHEGTLVVVEGVVTTLDGDRGFYLQDSDGDGNPATSDALYIFTRELENAPAVEPGMALRITGTVSEIGRERELTTTCVKPSEVQVVAEGRDLPEPVILGRQGRRPPSVVLDDDRLSDFRPEDDGLDFYESLEGMRIEVRQPLVVGPKNRYGDFAIVADLGVDATVRTQRGSVLRRPGDGNPEVLVVDGSEVDVPSFDTGDILAGSVRGVIGYRFGAYRLLARGEIPPNIDSEPRPSAATTLRSGPTALTVASFNVLNLAATDSEDVYRRLARVLARDLAGPDIVALQEVQDDNGRTDDGTVSAAETLGRLVRVVKEEGGPAYEWRQIDPENNADGGAPGSNIRVAFLLRPDRLEAVGEPSRVLAPAFDAVPEEEIGGTRKPLILPIRFAGQELFLVNLHLTSRRRDDRAMGGVQPPVLHSEPRRTAQARAVRERLDRLASEAPKAKFVVLGDFNEYWWNPPVRVLMGNDLRNLADSVPENERYSFNYGGVAQLLDQVLVSHTLAASAEIDMVHVCSDIAAESSASDHDPVVVRLDFAN